MPKGVGRAVRAIGCEPNGGIRDEQSSCASCRAISQARQPPTSVSAAGTIDMTGPTLRVAVVEPTLLVAQTFGLALGGAVDARAVVVGVDSSARSIAQEVLNARPGVVVVDCELGPHVDCAALVETFVEHTLRVVVLTNHEDDDALLGECLRRGAVAALHKSEGLAAIVMAVRQALAREPAMSSDEARHLMAVAQVAEDRRSVGRGRLSTLTVREREVLKLLMTGATALEIARLWIVSEATVRTQIKSILVKLEVSSQLAAVATAFQHGWVPPPRSPRCRGRRAAGAVPRPSASGGPHRGMPMA